MVLPPGGHSPTPKGIWLGQQTAAGFQQWPGVLPAGDCSVVSRFGSPLRVRGAEPVLPLLDGTRIALSWLSAGDCQLHRHATPRPVAGHSEGPPKQTFLKIMRAVQ